MMKGCMLLVAAALCACAVPYEEEVGEVTLAVHSPCLSDSECSGGATCDTSECLSCCEPGAEVCIAVCCGSCTDPGSGPRTCTSVLCAEGYEPITDANGCDHGCRPIAGTPCGPNRCGAGQYCCNESCGICAPIGGGCIQIACAPAP